MAAQVLDARQIFLEAVEKHAPEAWPEFLDSACGGDVPLRQRVEELLQAHGQYNQMLDGAGFVATIQQPVSERPGLQIGPYKLLQQIGEGGFGVVFMAEQLEPVRRKVALKVIKPGMDTRQVIARFEAERQALAVMDHPNIARVLDAGATESGRPYFVMELVRGTPITAYCDDNSLNIRERLELFAAVCQAIQHAHTKGIIHRDIKPSNVLVTRQDGQSVVKVIDFGIAKAMGQQLTDKTLFTSFAQMIGTPLYMSPEQAELSSTDIDTRSDVYSLGVLLYELLTGSTPVSKEQLKQAAIDEIRRIIREDEPPKPSTRISSAEAAPSIAAQRHTEPAKLTRLVRGELDWIVMKALEKDRSRRYETATGFAADVQRYLNDEAVLACPPSAAYRFRKFARRNKVALAMAGVVLSALLLGTIGLAVSNFLVRAERNQKDQALREKVTALGEKQVALSQAQANFVEARKQTEIANRQEKIATEQSLLANRRLYASQMNLAMQAWRAGDAPRVLELLEGQRPGRVEDDLRGFEWYYLWRLCNGGRMHLKGHTDAVLSLSYSPDGKTLASTGSDETIRLWDIATGRERMVLRKLAPWDVVFSPDGQTLACGGKTTPEVTLWKAATGEVLHTIPATVTGLAFSPDSRTLLGGGLSSRLWDVTSGKQRATFDEAGVMLGMLADAKTVVTLAGQFTTDGEVRLWDATDGARRMTIPCRAYTNNATLSPDRSRILIAAGGTVAIWDSGKGQQLSTYPAQDVKLRSLAISPDNKRLAAACDDRRMIVWDVETGQRIGQDVYSDVVWAVAFSPDSKTVASGTLGGDIKLWNMTPPDETTSIAIRGVADLRFSPDGKTLLVGNTGPTSIVDVSAGKEVAVVPFSGVRAFSAGGATAARLATDTEAVVWDAASGRELAHLPLPARNGAQPRNGGTPGIALSDDGRHAATFVSFFGDDTVKLWDIATKQFRTLTNDVHEIGVNCVEFSPDGKLLAAGFQFHWVVVWDVATGKVKLKFAQRPSMLWIRSLRFSPDSKSLAVGTDIGAVTLWNVHTGQRLADFRGHASNVDTLAFSPDGKVLATGGADKTVRLWDVHTGQERSTLTGHAAQVSNVLFSPDGNTLATSANDGTVRLWRGATNAEALAPRSAGLAPVGEATSGQSESSLALPATAVELTEAGLRDGVRRWPDEVGLHRRLGQLLVEQGRPADAEAALQEVVRLNPNAEDEYRHLAEVLRQQNKFTEAETALREAIRLNPTRPWTHDALGWLLVEQEKFAAAESEFREAVRLKPDLPSSHLGLGRTLHEQKKFPEALASVRQAIRLEPNSIWARDFLGWALVEQQEFSAAEAVFREQARLKPELVGGHFGLGRALVEQQKFAEAETVLREALRIDPQHVWVPQLLGRALTGQGKTAEAAELLKLKPGQKLQEPENPEKAE